MARPLRIEYENALYHVTSRGNRKDVIFFEEVDRKIFLDVLGEVVERYHWICYGYCLMTNHYHLLLETPKANLSEGMRQVNGIYTQRINRNYGRPGHLFQGRFRAILVEKEPYLLELCRYIVLNPVKAGMVREPGEWKWSSYSAILGTAKPPKFLNSEWVLAQFSEDIVQARQQYKKFVMEGEEKGSIWKDLRGQILFENERFLETIRKHFEDKKGIKEIRKTERLVNRETLHDIFTDIRSKADRNEKIYVAHFVQGYRLKEISDFLEVHYSTISKVIGQRKKIRSRKKITKFKT